MAQSIQRWMVAKDLTIGSMDGPNNALTRISGVLVAPDGAMYVLQPEEHTMRVFSPAGRFLRSTGRRGRGPGEFSRMSALGWKGDTLWVRDPDQRRLSLFSSSGEFLESITFSQQSREAQGLTYVPGFLLADGSVLGAPQVTPSEIAEGNRSRIPDVRFTRSGGEIQAVLALSSSNAILAVPNRGGGGTTPLYGQQPFSDAPIRRVAPDGSAIVVAERPVAAGPGRSRFRVFSVSPSGDTLFSVHVGYSPIRIPPARVREAVEQTARVAQRFGLARTRRAAEDLVREHMFLPASYPPVGDLVVGRDGTVWLKLASSGGGLSSWIVLDSRGRHIATAAVPSEVQVFQAQANALWGVVTDTTDVPYVVRYRVLSTAVRS